MAVGIRVTLLVLYLFAGAYCYRVMSLAPCDFFVSYKRGSDGAAGTIDAPFKTLRHAAYKVNLGNPLCDHNLKCIGIFGFKNYSHGL